MISSYIDVIKVRRMAFSSIARMAYEDEDLSKLNEEIFRLLPGEVATFRENIFRERAVIGERLRMALGLDARTAAETASVNDGVEEVEVSERIFNPPLVSVIKIACESCPERFIWITDNCRRCLAHPCINVCPVNAISQDKDGMSINHEKCVKCGKCVDACPYSAIIETGRPCSKACGVNAIGSDYLGRAEVDPEKCVACGACIEACPFGAISDKSQIFQLIKAMKKDSQVYAIIAPSFAGQFGPLASPQQVFAAIKCLGFKDVIEVALGADLTTMHEAKEFLETVPKERAYMGTSCCYSWKLMVSKLFPEQNPLISDSSTPMIYTAKFIKKKNPKAKICFIGPCISKKLESLQPAVKAYVDFVLTYEEVMGMLIAKDIDPGQMQVEGVPQDGSETGRNYAISGGVAEAVVARAKEIDPNVQVEVERAQGLDNCVKLMRMAKAGRMNGKLLEGMACSGGCVTGPGTVVPWQRSKKAVNQFAKESPFKSPFDNTNIPQEDKPC